MRFSLITAVAIVFALVASGALAQSPAADEPVLTEDDTHVLADYFSGRSACLDEYQFGSVVFDVVGGARQVTGAGQTLNIGASVENKNDFPLPEGRVYVHILRQDATVADENWHPLVYEGEVPGNFALAANEKKPFSFSWQIPAGAPAGVYRAEFFYLAGGRFVMAGLPYAANLSGGSALFSVTRSNETSYVEFDRGSVQLNEAPLALRSVPPVLENSGPITASVVLRAVGVTTQTVDVTASLYRWSITDGTAPVLQTTSQITLQPNGSATIPFSWDSPAAGAYEVVFEAKTANANQLPSRLKFRFPIAGSVPRIIFAGITGEESDNVTVTSCTVNATYGEDDGQATLSVSSTNGELLGSNTDNASATDLSTTQLSVPKSSLTAGITVAAQATDSAGNVTDSHQITYSAELLEPYIPQVDTTTPTLAEDKFKLSQGMILGIGSIIILILLALGIYTWQKRKRTPPTMPSINQPPDNPPQVP